MLKEKKILVAGSTFFPGNSYGNFVSRLGGELVYSDGDFLTRPDDFKLVVFTGGEDVTAELYGDTSPRKVCSNNLQRDVLEKKIFNQADFYRIKMFGICRGAQFLNVMTGGKMIHHLNGHAGAQHEITLSTSNIVPATLAVNSLHHQMCIPSSHTHIVAWSTRRLSNIYVGNEDKDMFYPGPEVEAIYNPSFRVLGVQWHPEMMLEDLQGHVMTFNMLHSFMALETAGFMAKYLPSVVKAYVTVKNPPPKE